VNSDEFGNIDFEDLKQKCEKHSKNISAFMVCMYACMYVCIYVSMLRICMYVCMYVCVFLR
jgi:glycine cleavage system protein P-like pyridoxal-binding family